MAEPFFNKFPLGEIEMSKAYSECRIYRKLIFIILGMHSDGVWGNVSPEQAAANEEALIHGGRIVSIQFEKVLVITEADRSKTTVKFVDEERNG